MKSTTLLLPLYTAALAAAASHPKDQVVLQQPQLIAEPDEYLIELSPGETRWITENEKWELRKVCSIALHGDLRFQCAL
jgi:leucyl aminopeptidase